MVFEDQKSVFFVEEKDQIPSIGIRFDSKPTKLTNFAGAPVQCLYFNSYEDQMDAKDTLASKGIRTYEADVRPIERFLMERFLKGGFEISAQKVEGPENCPRYINPQIRSCHFAPELSTLSLDIETGRDGTLYSVGMHFKKGEQECDVVFMLADKQGQGELPYLQYCSTEKALLQKTVKWIWEQDPDVIVGWHVVGFDFKFLLNKAEKLGGKFNIGRNKSNLHITEKKGAGFFGYTEGRVILDGPPVLRGNFYSFENFKLDTVANELLGVGKDISSDGGSKVAEIEERFAHDKPALAKYNLLDCKLVTQIFEKTQMLELLQKRTMNSGLLLDKHGMSSAAFDFFMLPKVHRAGFVAPNVTDIQRESHAAGGFVLDPEAGVHDDVIILDFKSLYPSIIRTFFIDPYSRLMAEFDSVKTPTDHSFSKTNNILPAFIKELMEKRAQAQRQNDQPLSMAIKILMNSFYGVMGSPGSRFYHADLPTAITGTGQWLLKECIRYFEERNLKVLYGDTDSVFVKIPKEEAERWEIYGDKLVSEFNEHLGSKLKREFDVDSYLVLECEKYFQKIFFPLLRGSAGSTVGAKKKYVGMNEKMGEVTLYFSGMEAVRSDWTSLAKNFQKTIFKKFFQEEPVDDFVRAFINDLKAGIFDDQLIYRKRLSKSPSEYNKNIPPHVRAALLLPEEKWDELKFVEYYYSMSGPVPTELGVKQIDYAHYIEKQIKPVADIVLVPLGRNFDSLSTGDQLALF